MKKLFILLALVCFTQLNATDVPYLTGRINDYAGILSDDAKQQLDRLLNLHEQETSNQIAILTILSLDDESLENYSYDVFNTWHLGQKDKDNGVLILISVNDKKIRIEVGYGLEGSLTDSKCSSIIRNEMAPNFRRNDYDAGVIAAAESVIGIINGTYEPQIKDISNEGFETVPFPMNIVMGIFVMSILGIFTLIGIFQKGCSGWFLFFFLIPFYATFPTFIFGFAISAIIFVLYIFGFIILKILLGSQKGREYMKKRVPRLNDTFSKLETWSSKSGSSGGRWSSGGGGFSGGGGSSGGGGASGGW